MSRGSQPIIIIRPRKVVGDGHHGGAWKVAYADFVTAMMAFFLMLWLLSNPDREKLKGIAQYFSPALPTAERGMGPGAPQVLPQPGEARPDAPDTPVVERRQDSSEATARMLANDLRIALQAAPQARAMLDNVRLTPSREGLRIQIMDSPDRPMFKPATAVLNSYATGLLEVIGSQLGARGARIALEGHTDAIGGNSDGNWRLSGDRAQAARAVLTGSGLSTDRVAEVVALAGTRPAFPDEPERAENRRITIVVLGERGVLPPGIARQP